MQLSDALLRELEALHPKQREAVLHPGNLVLRAGPGSGKTRTLVARIGYLLQTQISAFRGVACITYTNAAADEIRRRVLRSGMRVEGQISCSTVHAFCLNEILRAFAALTRQPAPQAGQVLSAAATETLLQSCFDAVGIAETPAQYRISENTRIRRALACDEPLSIFDPREVQAACLYEERLLAQGVIDFEAMVVRALHIVRQHEPVRDLLHARFPHLVVDEYQDLGGVLHELVLALHDMAGITIFAVGDIDQSVFGFTGADARYLTALRTGTIFATWNLTSTTEAARTSSRPPKLLSELFEDARHATARPPEKSTAHRSPEDWAITHAWLATSLSRRKTEESAPSKSLFSTRSAVLCSTPSTVS